MAKHHDLIGKKIHQHEAELSDLVEILNDLPVDDYQAITGVASQIQRTGKDLSRWRRLDAWLEEMTSR